MFESFRRGSGRPRIERDAIGKETVEFGSIREKSARFASGDGRVLARGGRRGCVGAHVGVLSTPRLCKITRPARTGSFRRTYTPVNYRPTVRTGRSALLSLFYTLSFQLLSSCANPSHPLNRSTPRPRLSLCSFALCTPRSSRRRP